MSTGSTGKTENGSNPSEDESQKIHSVLGIIFTILLVGVLGIVYVVDRRLPTALYINNEKNHPDSFITERAQSSLKSLTDLGPRITGGYPNEVLAVRLLKKEINDIVKSANKNKIIEVDVQLVSGAYSSYSIGNSLVNAYANLQNVVVKLQGNSSSHALLINAHFDTKPLGAGGGDDGINCANMLEILRKLSKFKETYEHDIIFLFNGAEEQGLQASHGFIAQHKWAKNIKAVLNLDAAGAGGKMAVLRTGPKRPWLMKYYKNVPYPTGQVIAEELFATEIVPSETDFSVFTGIAGLVGLDLGYYKDGYRYHTSYDGFDNIPEGSYQHGGENVLHLVRHLANAPELTYHPNETSDDNIVFYDYLGIFMVVYTETVAIIINVITIIMSLCISFRAIRGFGIGYSKMGIKYLLSTLGMILLGWILSAAFVVIIASVLDMSKQSLSWFTNSWLILGIYVLPVFIITCASIVALNRVSRTDLSTCENIQVQAHMITLIWTVVLLFGTAFRIRSFCFIQLLVFLQAVSYFIILLTRIEHTRIKWLIVYLIFTIIANLCIMQQAIVLFGFFIPVAGRIGSYTNAELLISGMTLLFTLLITSIYTPLIGMVRKPQIVLGVLTSLFVFFFILALTPIGFPYRGGNVTSPTPQRYWIHHTSRVLRNDKNHIYKNDGGFFLSNMDRNSPSYVEKYVSDFANVTNMSEECEKSIFCGLPLARFRSFGVTWIPAEKPIINKPPILTFDSRRIVNNVTTRLLFTAKGLDQIEVYISPKPFRELKRISLVPEKPEILQLWNDRPIYYIQYTCGKEETPLMFAIDVEVLSSNVHDPLVDIAVVGRYLHIDTNVKTEHYNEFIAKFPDWTDVVPWLAVYESWVY